MRAFQVSVALLALVISSACGSSASATARSSAGQGDESGKSFSLSGILPEQPAKARLNLKMGPGASLTRQHLTSDLLDLRSAARPTLRLRFTERDAVKVRIVWAVAARDFVEERVIAAPFRLEPGGSDQTFDLSGLKDTPGRLVIVASAVPPHAPLRGVLLDAVAIDDGP